jgi:transcription elongation factor Elf1
VLEVRCATALARIEPTSGPDRDQRTFECTACGHEDVVIVKFK